MKTAIFIDGANLSYTCKLTRYLLDWKKVKPFFDKDARATYYTAILRQPDGSDLLAKIKDYLEYNGYSVVTKESKTYEDPLSGLTRIKGNLDVEITVDMLIASEYFSHIILMSGDGDFTYAVKECQRRGCHVTVVSTMDAVSDELRRQCDLYIELKDDAVQSSLQLENKDGSSPRRR